MSFPLIETPRLILRAYTREDFPACLALWSDPEVMHFIGGPSSEEDSWARFMRIHGHWRLMGYGYWAVIERAGGRHIGQTGFLNVKRAIEPSLEGMPETGWSLARAWQGQGYANEAVGAMLAWGDIHFGRVRMCCIIAPENAPSMRLAERNGFKRGPLTVYKDEPIVVLYRDPPG